MEADAQGSSRLRRLRGEARILNSRAPPPLKQDSSYCCCAHGDPRRRGNFERSGMFSAQQPNAPVTHADTPGGAGCPLSERGRVDLPYMARLTE
ncbi:MAG: hypothetical protein ACLSVD_01585 [Eggerthellaceae bacterium]